MWRIKNWSKSYEVHRSRKVGGPLSWVAVSTDLSSLGYGVLVARENGAALLGAWLVLLELAARLPIELRGNLCGANGKAYSSVDLSVKSRIPARIFDEAIPILLEIEWLEMVPDVCISVQGGADAHLCAPTLHYKTEQLLLGDSGESLVVSTPKQPDLREGWFDQFWEKYLKWRSDAKKAAHTAFLRAVKTEATFVEVMAGLARHTPDMLRRERDKRPHAATWLNGERWKDGGGGETPDTSGGEFEYYRPEWEKE